MTAMSPPPAWRSLLFVPVTSERFVAKAHTRGAQQKGDSSDPQEGGE